MFWKKEILHDWMETPDSIAIWFYAVSGSPLSLRALRCNLHLLLSPASLKVCCCKALRIDTTHGSCAQGWVSPGESCCASSFCVSITDAGQYNHDSQCTVVLITLTTCLHSPAWFRSHFCAYSASWDGTSSVCQTVASRWRTIKGKFKRTPCVNSLIHRSQQKVVITSSALFEL